MHHPAFPHLTPCFMPKVKSLTDGKIAIWDPDNVDESVIIYTPPQDKSKRLHNTP